MEKLHTTIGISDFVKRQIQGSGKTYSNTLSFEDIANHATEQLTKGHYKAGYRDGVLLAKVDPSLINNYICPFVKIDEKSKLQAKMVRRRPEEEPYIQIRALNGVPLKTGAVDIILYRHDVLMETNEHCTNKDWELISFHAIPINIIEMPMGPSTMMRNQLELIGGTKAHYESEEWAKSVKFWQEYAVLDFK
tara:strand:+ start:4091 stop:4666 length:576 start_codon:yes stop_codon:yes gene_type:complete